MNARGSGTMASIALLLAFLLLNWAGAQDKDGPKVKEKGQDKDPSLDTGKLPLHAGLVAHYFKDPIEWEGAWPKGGKPAVNPKDYTFRSYAYTKLEPHVNHLTVHRGWFSVRWAGWLKIPPGQSGQKGGEESCEFDLELWMDDGARLFLDQETLVDDWVHCPESDPASHRMAKKKLAPGLHRLVIEYFQGESLSENDLDPAKFYWSCDALKIPRQIVPASHFFHTAADLQDYVPSQGLSPADAKRLKGGEDFVVPQPRSERALAKIDK